MMNKRTAKALEGSINKWSRIVQQFDRGEEVVERGAHDCPLCILYFCLPECGDCPIAFYTSVQGCGNTPYIAWTKQRTKQNAQAMLDFLISLR